MTPHPARNSSHCLSFKRLIIATCIMVLLACASKVRLDDLPPVDNRNTNSSNTGQALGQGGNQQTLQNNNNAGTGSASGAGGGSGAGGSGSSTVIKTIQTIANDSAQPQSGLLAQRSVYFDYDSFSIRDDAKTILNAHATYLSGNRSLKIALEGHTDDRGGREYNLALGQKRANAVQQVLQLLGVSEAQMEAVSFGKEKPTAQGNSESDYAQNRRVDIQYK